MLARFARCGTFPVSLAFRQPTLLSVQQQKILVKDVAKRFCQTAAKPKRPSPKRGELWKLISLASPEKHWLAGKAFHLSATLTQSTVTK